ncbi:hypothetical protein AC1031_001228 [Aphanomyces cochlioides]|nr:hypothetical protein AC1031_001228 [Aphanomyces cochlioides]
MYALLVDKIENGDKAFGISGTPGIGKSLFFAYILYRLVHRQSFRVSFKRIIYQTGLEFEMFDLENFIVFAEESFGLQNLLDDRDTFYIIDGMKSVPVSSSCSVLYIACPQSKEYKEFVKQRKAKEWFMPVWTLSELDACRKSCYPRFDMKTLDDRYRIFGGIARTDDGNYQFECVDIASKYVGEQLWQKQSKELEMKSRKELYGSIGPFECPCYKYPMRTDRYIIFMVTMKCPQNRPPRHWGLRGVALLCSQHEWLKI